MALFRMTEKRDWAKDLLDNGVLPSIHNGYGYTGISALKNSDVLIQTGGNPVILITGWIALAYVSKLLI